MAISGVRNTAAKGLHRMLVRDSRLQERDRSAQFRGRTRRKRTAPSGSRTRVAGVKSRCPRPLDDRGNCFYRNDLHLSCARAKGRFDTSSDTRLTPDSGVSLTPGNTGVTVATNHTKEPGNGKLTLPADSPLSVHYPTNRFYRKVAGKRVYLCSLADGWQAALNRWNSWKDDLLAGRPPRDKTGALTLRELVSQTLQGWLGARQRSQYGPADQGLFKWSFAAGVLQNMPRYGQESRKPAARVLRLTKAERPAKMFTADEIRRLIGAAPTATPQAMVLLGVNAACSPRQAGPRADRSG